MENEFVFKSEIIIDESNSDNNHSGSDNNEQQLENSIESNAKKERKRCEKTTGRQYKKIISFMENRAGYIKGADKAQKLYEGWNRLTVELNSIGPPRHTCMEWKKIWTNFKANQKRKNRITNQTMTDLETPLVVSRNIEHTGDSRVFESQYESWTITDQSQSTDTFSQSDTKEERGITTNEDFHSKIINRIDLVVGEQTRLNMKIDLLIDQQVRLNENFEKLIKLVEEKSKFS